MSVWELDSEIRKNCVAGTELYRQALEAANYIVAPAIKKKPKRSALDSIEEIKRDAKEFDADVDALLERLTALQAPGGPGMGHKIARAVAKYHNLSFQQLISASRFKEFVRARHHAMYEMRENTELSLPAIGRVLGHRDHTTVLHGVRKHAKRIATGDFPDAE